MGGDLVPGTSLAAVEANLPRGISRRAVLRGCGSAAAGLSLGLGGAWSGSEGMAAEPATPVFDGKRAYDHLRALCELGPRLSGSEGMDRQQRIVADHFLKLRAKVRFQSFDAPHPQTGNPVAMNNLVVSAV